jgi:hypothetical protein
MSDEPKDAKVELRKITISGTMNEADRKFILALIVVVFYVIAIMVPIVRNDMESLKTTAAVMTGVVGTVLGYYFGSKKEQ